MGSAVRFREPAANRPALRASPAAGSPAAQVPLAAQPARSRGRLIKWLLGLVDSLDECQQDLRANLRYVLTMVASCLATAIAVLVFLAVFPGQTASLPYCDPGLDEQAADSSTCLPCPSHGICEAGALRGCRPGYRLVAGVFGSPRSCQETV